MNASMLFLISPAKSLDYDTPAGDLPHTLPQFMDHSGLLIKSLRKKNWRQISKLMDLSQDLSELNVARYAAWTDQFTPHNAKQAVLAFNGDVYDGLSAKTLAASDLAWAQQKVCILSGLYGVLRPMDLMQPYRLEMGTSLKVGRANNLYQYWGDRIANHLNAQLQLSAQGETHVNTEVETQGDSAPVVVNLASQEYFKAVNLKALKATVVECVFEDFKNGQYKVISFFAKRARGLMVRHAVQCRASSVQQLESFCADGYAHVPGASTPLRLVFRRKLAE